MRDRYLRQLKLVHDDLLRMGSRVEHALARGCGDSAGAVEHVRNSRRRDVGQLRNLFDRRRHTLTLKRFSGETIKWSISPG